MPHDDHSRMTLSRRAALGLATGGALHGVSSWSDRDINAQAEHDFDSYATRILTTPVSDRNAEALVEALALLGIAVYQRPGDLLAIVQPVPPRSPLKLLQFQVSAMAQELAARTGTPGHALDTAVPSPEGVPPVSSLLAGYVAAGQTAGAMFARELLGDQDWELWSDRYFPSAVIDMFVSDVAMTDQIVASKMKIMHLNQPSGVCSAVQTFTSDVLETIFGQLKVDVPKSESNLLTDVWNWIIGAGQDVVEEIGDVITAPVIAAIQAIAGALAIGTSLSSMLQAWTVTLDAEPAENRFGVDNEFVTGRFVGGIDAGGAEDWPEFLVDCAATMGITLPSLRGEGSVVTWKISETPIDLIVEMGKSPLVEDGGKAEYIYQTKNESADVASGTPLSGLCIAEIAVERSDVAELRDNLLNLLVANLPSPVDLAVESVLGPAIASLTADLAQVMVKGYSFETLPVIYHEKQVTVTSEPQPPALSCPVGSWYMYGFGAWFDGLMSSMGGGPMTFIGSSGRLVLDLRPDGTYSVASEDFEAMFVDGTFSYLASMSGTESGTYSADNGTLSGTQTGGGLLLVVEAEGYFSVELPFVVVSDTGSMGYACTDFGLMLYPPTTGSNGVEWRPNDSDGG